MGRLFRSVKCYDRLPLRPSITEEKPMKKILALSCFIAASILTRMVSADILIDTLGTPSNASSVSATQYNAIAFSLSAAFTDVSIDASLVSSLANQTGTAYLTTAIGAGTTAADLIASNGFTFTQVSSTTTQLGYVNLFSGLSLAADDYFLIFGAPLSGSGAISLNPAATYSTDPDVTVGSMLFSGGANLDLTFAPASTFGASGLGNRFLRVNGIAVPEPSALGILGFAGLALLRRRRVANS
jgi:hypothetical protein